MADIDEHEDIERALMCLRVIGGFNRDIARINKLKQGFIDQVKAVGDERIKGYISEQLKRIDKDSALHDA